MPRNRASAAAIGLPENPLFEIHDLLLLALDASERRDGYSLPEREARSYVRAALRRAKRLMGALS
ncbi:hypothetical protein [Amaricoccus solimangrovi]|uniref:Uncharacterized protein n=1 Tax=Amaricoccus solimangrovi TaxID=2589815 RepID=A0A501X171_9RHOB|nr:hypothetical protein [Amaricoccus solimangrovi]TPE53216.1 hypothetical protein FJM51_04135 [Amaricoccus solimangrovi]